MCTASLCSLLPSWHVRALHGSLACGTLCAASLSARLAMLLAHWAFDWALIIALSHFNLCDCVSWSLRSMCGFAPCLRSHCIAGRKVCTITQVLLHYNLRDPWLTMWQVHGCCFVTTFWHDNLLCNVIISANQLACHNSILTLNCWGHQAAAIIYLKGPAHAAYLSNSADTEPAYLHAMQCNCSAQTCMLPEQLLNTYCVVHWTFHQHV